MKKNLPFLKTVFLLLFTLFLLQGCREEVKYTENFTPTKPRDKSEKNLSFREFSLETKQNFTSVSNAIQKTSDVILNAKKSQNIENEFSIDTTFIRKTMKDGNVSSFSIRAYKKGENPENVCYNIVYHKKENQWTAEIFKFSYSKQFIEEYQKNAYIPFAGKIEHIKNVSTNKPARVKEVYECEYTVVPMCYCANHTPENCRGCNEGFRNVGVLDCTEVQDNIGGGSATNNPFLVPAAYPPFNDSDTSYGGGGGTSINPYAPGSIDFDNNLPVFDDPVFLENSWNYHLWNGLGTDWITRNYGVYTILQQYHILTRGQNLEFIKSIVSQNSNNIDFIRWAAQFLNQNPDTTKEQFQKWFVEGYSTQYQNNLTKLTDTQLQEFVSINKEINASPYEEEFVKEANEEFVAFSTLGDIDNLTIDQIKTILTLIYPQYYQTVQRAKLINANYQFNRKFYPEWSNARCLWEAARESIQLMLDLGGLVPVIGEACDLTNGVIYTIQGDKLNAGLSYASAIPVAGWFASGVKIGGKVVNKAASDIASRQVLRWIVGTDGLIYFGVNNIKQARNQLRRVLKLTDATKHAHHLIPVEFAQYAIVQKAAKSKEAFHINEAINGIPLPNTAHLTGHNLYNDKIREKLILLDKVSPTNEIAYQKLITFSNDLRNLIKNNPNMNLGQIASLIK